MASKVEIIIEAVDKTKKPITDAEKRLERLKKQAKANEQAFRGIAAGVGIAVGVFYAAIQATEQLADKLDSLGQRKAAENLRGIKTELDNLVDRLLTTETGFGKVGEVIGTVANLLATIPIRGYAAAISLAGGATKIFTNTLKFLGGVIDELRGKTTEFTAEWLLLTSTADATAAWDKAVDAVMGKLVEFGTRTKSGTSANKKNTESIIDRIEAMRKLRKELSADREEAIRTGDVRALKNINRKISDAGAANAPAAKAMSEPSSRDKGGGTQVNVYIGGEKMNNIIEKTMVKNVLKPALGKAKSGSLGGRKNSHNR